MSDSDDIPTREKWQRAYDDMMVRVKTAYEEAEESTRPALENFIHKARDTAVELEELTHDEAEKVAYYLKRDLQDAGKHLAETGQAAEGGGDDDIWGGEAADDGGGDIWGDEAVDDSGDGGGDFWGDEASEDNGGDGGDFWGGEEDDGGGGDDFWGEDDGGGGAAAPLSGTPDTEFSDAIALQFPLSKAEGVRKPYFMFGDAQNPVDLWFVDTAKPNAGTRYEGRGSSAVSLAEGGDEIETSASYEDGQWSVIFKRQRKSSDGKSSTHLKSDCRNHFADDFPDRSDDPIFVDLRTTRLANNMECRKRPYCSRFSEWPHPSGLPALQPPHLSPQLHLGG